MDKCKILVPVGCRSDEGISKPIIKRLKENDMFEVKIFNIDMGNISLSYFKWFETFEDNYPDFLHWKDHWKSDIVFITGDRIEMCAVAYQAFHNHIPITHYLAGVLNYPISTLDDINRHVITLYSNIQLCESYICSKNVQRLFNSLGLGNKTNRYVVGSTYLDDLEIDDSLVLEKDYDLLLVNPTTLIKEIQNFQMERKTIVIGSNPDIPLDTNWEPFFITYDNLPRDQFLGLLKNCKRFITNSSSAYYEAPYFLKPEQIIIIGDRNKNRTSKFEDLYNTECASNNIISVLEGWWLSQNE